MHQHTPLVESEQGQVLPEGLSAAWQVGEQGHVPQCQGGPFTKGPAFPRIGGAIHSLPERGTFSRSPKNGCSQQIHKSPIVLPNCPIGSSHMLLGIVPLLHSSAVTDCLSGGGRLLTGEPKYIIVHKGPSRTPR